MACTTILVGKGASYDGSTLVARNEDCGATEFTEKHMEVVLPEQQPKIYRSVLSHVEIPLPERPMRYTAMPDARLRDGQWAAVGVNERNVSMSATETLTTNPRVQGADPMVVLTPAKGSEGEPDYVPELPRRNRRRGYGHDHAAIHQQRSGWRGASRFSFGAVRHL